jgi:homoaconitase/3-isopropylmalate dehydratase large subunit
LEIDDYGRVWGTVLLNGQTKQAQLSSFIYRANTASRKTGKTEQQLIDDVANQLGLYREDIIKLTENNTTMKYYEVNFNIAAPEALLDDARDILSALAGDAGFEKALNYMGFKPGQKLIGTKVDYVFLGACTNGRIEDFRAFASIVKGRQKAADVIAWLVPGSWAVDKQIREEGLDKVLEAAGFEIRQPGCSACLAMNDDKIPAGKLSVSTSNRNFEGRQGPGARTILASPLTAAAAAVTGVITDPRDLLLNIED